MRAGEGFTEGQLELDLNFKLGSTKMNAQVRKNFVKGILTSILNDNGGLQYNQPDFLQNPLGHILWMRLKGKPEKLIKIKISVLLELEEKGPKYMSYSYRKARAMYQQLVELSNVGLSVSRFAEFLSTVK